MSESRSFLFAFFALSLCAMGLLSSCKKAIKDEPTEVQSKVVYYYSDSTLDAKSQSLLDSYHSEEYLRTVGIFTSAMWDKSLEKYKDSSYASYAGAVPEYRFRCDTSSIYDANGYRTIVVEKDKNYTRNIIYVHGGSWTYQVSDGHLSFVDGFIPMANAKAYIPLYPLLPNNNHATTMEMLLALYEKLLQEGKSVLLIGDSAGANIMLGFVNYLKELGKAMPTCVLPMSPAVDLTGASMSEMQKYVGRDPFLSPDIFTNQACKTWAGEREVADPVISPTYGDLQNFPPMFMFIGTEEMLYYDAIQYAEKVAAAGTKTEVLIGRGLWHVATVDDIPVTALYYNLALQFIKSVDGK